MNLSRFAIILFLCSSVVYGWDLFADRSQNWRGCYVGVHAGYGWSSELSRSEPRPNILAFPALAPTPLNLEARGGMAGIQVGYNYRMHDWVSGIEADISGGNISGSVKRSPIITAARSPFPGSTLELKRRTGFLGTARLRLGYAATACFLLYATGGLAYSHTHFQADADFRSVHFPFGINQMKVGWTVGAGIEYIFCRCWSMVGEFLFYDFGEFSRSVGSQPLPSTLRVRYRFVDRIHLFRLGFNYKL